LSPTNKLHKEIKGTKTLNPLERDFLMQSIKLMKQHNLTLRELQEMAEEHDENEIEHMS
jgi:hypothetical protein